jgi:hypothetical protein
MDLQDHTIFSKFWISWPLNADKTFKHYFRTRVLIFTRRCSTGLLSMVHRLQGRCKYEGDTLPTSLGYATFLTFIKRPTSLINCHGIQMMIPVSGAVQQCFGLTLSTRRTKYELCEMSGSSTELRTHCFHLRSLHNRHIVNAGAGQ